MGCDIHNTLLAYDREAKKLVDILHRGPTEEEQAILAKVKKLKDQKLEALAEEREKNSGKDQLAIWPKDAIKKIEAKIWTESAKLPMYEDLEAPEPRVPEVFFEPFFDGRSYDFFSLFGVRGSSEYEIFDSRTKYGKPNAIPWLLDDCHSFQTFKASVLERDFKDIMKRMAMDISKKLYDDKGYAKDLQHLYGMVCEAKQKLANWQSALAGAADGKYEPGTLELGIWFDS